MAENQKKININLSDETRSFQERIDEIRTLVEENLRLTKSLDQSGSSSNTGGVRSQRELQKLLEENLKISKELYEMTKKIKQWVAWQKVWGVLKILIILVPLTLGIIYGPTLLRGVIMPYQELLNLGGNTNNQNLLQQVQSLINTEKNEPVPN